MHLDALNFYDIKVCDEEASFTNQGLFWICCRWLPRNLRRTSFALCFRQPNLFPSVSELNMSRISFRLKTHVLISLSNTEVFSPSAIGPSILAASRIPIRKISHGMPCLWFHPPASCLSVKIDNQDASSMIQENQESNSGESDMIRIIRNLLWLTSIYQRCCAGNWKEPDVRRDVLWEKPARLNIC